MPKKYFFIFSPIHGCLGQSVISHFLHSLKSPPPLDLQKQGSSSHVPLDLVNAKRHLRREVGLSGSKQDGKA